MRELKFRAWDKKRKKMFVPNISTGHGFTTINEWFKEAQPPSTDYWTLMQYTGLKDKNGVEIFEGDIIKFTEPDQIVEMGNSLSEAGIRIIEVLKDTQQLGWKGSGYTFCKNNCKKLMEVIGNIYQNKELLK